ncbi:MAG: 50S ribosomal protein L17 [Chloroflexota bacterium]|nr:50S ribosomal protein L17 [Chloroflexota bacterium]
MRHRVAGRHLGRNSAHRTALFRNLMRELFRHERIRTTKAKASAIRSDAEHLITLAKRGNARAGEGEGGVHERRRVSSILQDEEVARKLFEEIAPRFVDRHGGYTRTLKLGGRKGDGAEMVIMELVE